MIYFTSRSRREERRYSAHVVGILITAIDDSAPRGGYLLHARTRGTYRYMRCISKRDEMNSFEVKRELISESENRARWLSFRVFWEKN